MKRIIRIVIALHFSLFTALPGTAQIIHVPSDQPTIQAAINVASGGDTVLVSDGTYYENINFIGKAITITSNYSIDGDTNHIYNTIINGSQLEKTPVVTLNSDEDTTSIICGFTLTGGSGLYVEAFDMVLGGGIATNSAGVKVLKNRIINNEINHSGYAGGGGIGCVSEDEENWLVAKHNTISDNQCNSTAIEAFGGGVFSGTNLVLENNQIENNTCTNTSNMEANGGGVLLGSQSRTLIFNIRENIIHQNICTGRTVVGAGILIYYSEGTFTGNTLSNNTGIATFSAQGGGLNLHGATDEIDITDNSFYSNILQGEHVQGGGLQLALADENVYIQNNTFDSNHLFGNNQVKGGGIMVVQNRKVFIENNNFQYNTLEGGSNVGAGLFLNDLYDKVKISSNKFYHNETLNSGYGGGIALFDGNNLQIEVDGNIFESNISAAGGGVYTYNCYNTVFTNNLFIQNDASESGGGCRLRHYGNKRSVNHPVFFNNTFFKNNSPNGGGIYCDHNNEFPLIINTIFWENTGEMGKNIYYSGNDTILISYSDIDTEYVKGYWNGENNINVSPEFKDDSCHLDWPSLCVNAGTDSLEVYGVWYHSPLTDIDGDARPFEWTKPDIGADEAQWYYVGTEEFDIPGSKLEVQNYPNPFTTSTTIEYELAHPQTVTITFYNQFGKQVDRIEQKQSAGKQQVAWNAESQPAGIYYFRLEADGRAASGKMVLMR